MKVRTGFVSNSSSVSFCIYGIYVEENKLFEELEEIADKLDLYSHCDQYDGGYVGREWSSIGDNETGADFKEDVQTKINKLPIKEKDKECSTYEEGWYDG